MVEFEDGRGSLGHSATPRFPIPAHQTERADFPAFGFPTGFTVRHTGESLNRARLQHGE